MSDEVKITAGRLDETPRDRATKVIYHSLLDLLGMFYGEEGIDDGIILACVFQVAGTLANAHIKEGNTTRELWHEALDKAIDIAELNAAGPRTGSPS